MGSLSGANSLIGPRVGDMVRLRCTLWRVLPVTACTSGKPRFSKSKSPVGIISKSGGAEEAAAAPDAGADATGLTEDAAGPYEAHGVLPSTSC